MKSFGFCALVVLLLGTAFTFLAFSIIAISSSLAPALIDPSHKIIPDLASNIDKEEIYVIGKSRKLKDFSFGRRSVKSNDHHFNLEDYGPTDPVPSKASIRPGPIQHGAPLMPYIPKPSSKPSPPGQGHPKTGALP